MASKQGFGDEIQSKNRRKKSNSSKKIERQYQIGFRWKPEFIASERKWQIYRTNRGKNQERELENLLRRVLKNLNWGKFIIAEVREIGATKGFRFFTDLDGEMSGIDFYNRFKDSNEYIAKWFEKKKEVYSSSTSDCLFKAFIVVKGSSNRYLDSHDVTSDGVYGEDVGIADIYKKISTKPLAGTFDMAFIYRQSDNIKVGAYLPNGMLIFYDDVFEKQIRASTNFKMHQMGIR